jgi:hypothetical protein
VTDVCAASIHSGTDHGAVAVVSLGRMANSSPRTLEEWRAWYRATAEALERVRLQELAALSDEDALKRTLSLRLFAALPDASSEWSGLVEQQALFRRLHPR